MAECINDGWNEGVISYGLVLVVYIADYVRKNKTFYESYSWYGGQWVIYNKRVDVFKKKKKIAISWKIMMNSTISHIA